MKPLTNCQRKTFFSLVRSAAAELGEEPETYRKRILREELGVEHMADVSRTDGFDKLMTRLWQDLGDYERASAYVGGSLIRLKHLIVAAAAEIVSKAGKGTALDYIAGVMFRSGLIATKPSKAWAESLASEGTWMAFSEREVRALLMMLNAHLARLRRAG